MRTTLRLAAALALVAMCAAKSVPSYIHICQADNPQYSECLLKTVESFRPKLAKGIPKLHVPALEPLQVEAVEFQAGLENINGKVKVTNVRAFGPSKFIINSLKVDPQGLALRITLTFPTLSGEGDYDVDGRILNFALKSKGHAKANFTDVRTEVRGVGKVVTHEDGVRYLEIDQVASKTRLLGESKLKLVSGDDDKSITHAFNNFFHENRGMIYEVVYPILDETVDDLIVQIGNDILSRLPFDEILPGN